MGIEAVVTSVPERFSVVNLLTNEEVIAQLNPTEFSDEIGAEWEKLSTPGQSHSRMHFKNTDNYTVSLDLRFRAYSQAELVEMTRAKHQLLSWAYPQGGQRGGAPPRLLATWPLAFSIQCVLLTAKFKNTRFLRTGAVADWTASLVFEEQRDKKISFDQVALVLVVRGEL